MLSRSAGQSDCECRSNLYRLDFWAPMCAYARLCHTQHRRYSHAYSYIRHNCDVMNSKYFSYIEYISPDIAMQAMRQMDVKLYLSHFRCTNASNMGGNIAHAQKTFMLLYFYCHLTQKTPLSALQWKICQYFARQSRNESSTRYYKCMYNNIMPKHKVDWLFDWCQILLVFLTT